MNRNTRARLDRLMALISKDGLQKTASRKDLDAWDQSLLRLIPTDESPFTDNSALTERDATAHRYAIRGGEFPPPSPPATR